VGNLSYVSSRKNLTVEGVEAQLHEINERRFGGYFTIKRSDPESYIGADGWEFWCDAWDKSALFGYRLASKRKIEGGHARPSWRWADWCVAVFENELGAAWKGRISDDGVPETWAPVADKFPTFREWQDMWFGDSTIDPEFVARMRKHEQSEIPEALRPYALPEDTNG